MKLLPRNLTRPRHFKAKGQALALTSRVQDASWRRTVLAEGLCRFYCVRTGSGVLMTFASGVCGAQHWCVVTEIPVNHISAWASIGT